MKTCRWVVMCGLGLLLIVVSYLDFLVVGPLNARTVSPAEAMRVWGGSYQPTPRKRQTTAW